MLFGDMRYRCKHLFRRGLCSRCAIPPVPVKTLVEAFGGKNGEPCGDQYCAAVDLYLAGEITLERVNAIAVSKRIIPIL